MNKPPNGQRPINAHAGEAFPIKGAWEVAEPASATPQQMTLAEALNLWVELTGAEPGLTGLKAKNYSMGELSVSFLHKEIEEALRLDSTELTGVMLLSYIAQEYFENRKFTVDEMLNQPDRVGEYLSKANRLSDYLRSAAVSEPTEAFASNLLSTLQSYGAANKDPFREDTRDDTVTELMSQKGKHGDRGILAVLRRDAMRSMAGLRIDQFLDGNPESEDVRPFYGKFIYRWENINSMLRAMVSAPSGITVNMIQNAANPFGVYFVFAIRNGGRLFTFTDKEWVPHPLAEGMWRRPDKILAARASRAWFPYDLAGLKFNEEGKAYLDLSSGRSLVQYQAKALPIKPLNELEPPQVVWIAMMLDLIVEKFWSQGHKQKELSYTGEMVTTAQPLLESARSAGLPLALRSEQTLKVPEITLTSVHSDAVSEQQVGPKGDGRNRWLEDRYAHQVLPDTLQIVAPQTESFLVSLDQPMIPPQSEPTALKSMDRLPYFEQRKAVAKMTKVEALSGDGFGTKTELEADRMYLARTNYTAQIQSLANSEFEQRRAEIKDWVKSHMVANVEGLKSLLGTPEALVDTTVTGAFGGNQVAGVRYLYASGQRHFSRHTVLTTEERKCMHRHLGSDDVTLYRVEWNKCYFTGSASSYLVSIFPENAVQLAYLCGVEVHELPDVLQHWSLCHGYFGNPILKRLDPLQGFLESPWNQMSLKLNVFVSKRAYKELQGAAHQSPWLEPDSWKKPPSQSAPV